MRILFYIAFLLFWCTTNLQSCKISSYVNMLGLVRFAAKKYNRDSTKEEEYLTNTSTGKKYTALSLLTWTFEKLRAWYNNNGYSAAKVFESIHTAVVSLLLASEYVPGCVHRRRFSFYHYYNYILHEETEQMEMVLLYCSTSMTERNKPIHPCPVSLLRWHASIQCIC